MLTCLTWVNVIIKNNNNKYISLLNRRLTTYNRKEQYFDFREKIKTIETD